MKNLRERLDAEVQRRNCEEELCHERPDPLMVAKKYQDESVALICALFSYGKAESIVRFLESLEYGLLDQSEEVIRDACAKHYYRFQTPVDTAELFVTLRRLKLEGGIEGVFVQGYQDGGIFGGIKSLIEILYGLNSYRSRGYEFLIGKPLTLPSKASALKRWMMYLRWMVRSDALDMGLWKGICQSDLIIPLDTHTFNVSHRLGLLERKQCDFLAAVELTEKLKRFDPKDPVKYDFALYRLGQEKLA